MKRAILMFAILLLTGCATSEKITLPDGRAGYAIECGGYTTWTDCLKKAGELCGSDGYHVHGRSESVGQSPLFAPTDQGYMAFAGTVPNDKRMMVISCR